MTIAPPTDPPPVQPGPASPTAVIGDGTTVTSRVRTRWERARWPIAVAAVFLTVALISSLLTARTSAVPLAPDNPGDAGARALAQILRDQGVRIEYVRSLGAAVAEARDGTTLLVTSTDTLFGAQLDELAQVEADLVLIDPVGYHLEQLTGGSIGIGTSADGGPQTAQCDDPDAQAAEEIAATGGTLVAGSSDAITCFPGGNGDAGGSYAVVDQPNRRVAVIGDAELMTNAHLAENGNAALLLRTLGHHEVLIWYVPSYTDTSTSGAGPGLGDLLPPWFGALFLQVLLVVLALTLWRGRRLGRVVTEPLPVTVRAAETTLGRGRLYRRARSRGHAGAALRAGTARRAAARVGLPRSAGATDVIDALARATGRPIEQVAGLLYGPPPTDDAGLLQLARQLDELESEVHRT